jgi:hypothetical protein
VMTVTPVAKRPRAARKARLSASGAKGVSGTGILRQRERTLCPYAVCCASLWRDAAVSDQTARPRITPAVIPQRQKVAMKILGSIIVLSSMRGDVSFDW